MWESAIRRDVCTHVNPSERPKSAAEKEPGYREKTVSTGTVRVREEALLPCSQGSRHKGNNRENTELQRYSQSASDYKPP
jgi:hypothetical protein